MKVARIRTPGGPRSVRLDGDALELLDGDPIVDGIRPTGTRVDLATARFLLPVEGTTKVAAIGKNYLDHLAEMGDDAPPPELQIFLKPTTSLVASGDDIVRPPQSDRVEYEGELAVVIGRTAKDVAAADVDAYIFGYTVANDVSARDIQLADVQWTRGKSYDTFCPVGPFVETDFDPAGHRLTTRVNGEVRQDAGFELLIRGVPEIVEFISHAFTLLPGDIVLTGTPGGVGLLRAGDVVSVEISGIGELVNPVR